MKEDANGKYFDPNDLYHVRVLVFMESAPFSNEYLQVMLNEDQFKTLSNTLGSLYKKEMQMPDGTHRSVVRTGMTTHKLPDLPEAYKEEDLKKFQI